MMTATSSRRAGVVPTNQDMAGMRLWLRAGHGHYGAL